MLIPRKSHSRVKSRNSWVSIETLNFARVQRTIYRHDRSWIAGRDAQGEAIASRSPTLFLADAGTPSIDQHSRQRHARNVAKWLGATGRTTGDAQWPIGLWTTGRGIAVPPLPPPRRTPRNNGRRCGRIGTQNGGQRPGLRHHGTPVKKQTCSATGVRNRRLALARPVWETTGLLSGGR